MAGWPREHPRARGPMRQAPGLDDAKSPPGTPRCAPSFHVKPARDPAHETVLPASPTSRNSPPANSAQARPRALTRTALHAPPSP